VSVISLNFNTESKEMTVTMDGKTLENIRRAEFHNFFGDESFSATLVQVDDSRKDMTKTEVTNANKDQNKDKNKKKNIRHM